MADFKTLNGYTVKDPNAGRTLAVNGNQLQLKNPAGGVISTVNLPGGGGKAVIAIVQPWSTPDQWQTDEQLQFGYYTDGNGTTLNASDVAQYLADGAVPYISYDSVLIVAGDVTIDTFNNAFSLSASTTIADFNKVYTGMTPYSGSDTDTFNITVNCNGGSSSAIGNYHISGGGSYTWSNINITVSTLQVGRAYDIATDFSDTTFSGSAMFAVLNAGGFVSITLGLETATCIYVDNAAKLAYFYFAQGKRLNANPNDDKWITINDLGELRRTV